MRLFCPNNQEFACKSPRNLLSGNDLLGIQSNDSPARDAPLVWNIGDRRPEGAMNEVRLF